MVGYQYRTNLRENNARLKKTRCQAGDSPSWRSKIFNHARRRSEHVHVLERPSQSPDLNRFYESVAMLENCSSQLLSILSDWTGATFCQRRMGKNSLSSMCKAVRDPPQSAFNCNCSKTWFDKVSHSSVQIHVTLLFHFIYLFFLMRHVMLTCHIKSW